MTIPMICFIKSLLDIPFCAMTYFQQDSFSLSIAGILCQLVIAKGWTAPAILILKTVVDPSISSVAISMFFLFLNLVNSISSAAMGIITLDVDPETNPYDYGLKMSAFTIFPCILSLPFFLKAAFVMKQIATEKIAAQNSEKQPEDSSP